MERNLRVKEYARKINRYIDGREVPLLLIGFASFSLSMISISYLNPLPLHPRMITPPESNATPQARNRPTELTIIYETTNRNPLLNICHARGRQRFEYHFVDENRGIEALQ